MSRSPREALKDARRVVVKIGSRAIAGNTPDGRFGSMAKQIAEQRAAGRSVVLVSSGAITLGLSRLGLTSRPRAIARLQASAAVGQSQLMRCYEDAFASYGMAPAQVLLTHSDLADRDRYLNARGAIDALIELGAVPVINENDTVAVEEIKFGDNDQLAAMVATLASADLLVLLTNVDGVLDPHGAPVRLVSDPTQASALVRAETSDVGTGGMKSKVDAASRAARRGVPVVIADASDEQALTRILGGDEVGTLFLPHGSPLASRKHWIAYTLKPKGAIVVDDGAKRALIERQRSLLPAGVIGVRGDFEPGDAVRIVDSGGQEIARGLARYGTRDVARLAGARSEEIEAKLGRAGDDEIVHRDDLVAI